MCTATSDGIGARIASGLRQHGVVYSRRAKSLGVGAAAGARRCVGVQASRLTKFVKKLKRVAALFFGRASPSRFIATGGAASLTYGDDCWGVSDATLLRRRRAVAAVVAAKRGGRDMDLTLAMAEARGSRYVDPAFDAHAIPLSRWAEAVWAQWVPRDVVQRTSMLAKLK